MFPNCKMSELYLCDMLEDIRQSLWVTVWVSSQECDSSASCQCVIAFCLSHFQTHQDGLCAMRWSFSLNLFVQPSLCHHTSTAVMGFCESTRARRCQGFSGTLGAFVGALLLGVSLAQSAPPNSTCGANVTTKILTQPQYKDIKTTYTAEDLVSPFVHSFLHTVQPNPFPGGKCPYYCLHIKASWNSFALLGFPAHMWQW